MQDWFNPQGQWMAQTHQYQEGRTVLASGVSDPTRLNYQGAVLKRGHKDHEVCPDCNHWRAAAEQARKQLLA
jgi:hypothetical protein